MKIITEPGKFTYISSADDWRVEVSDGRFAITAQLSDGIYSSGNNLDSLARLIDQAKDHAIRNGINWSGN